MSNPKYSSSSVIEPLQRDVRDRFGVLPNFFRLASETPDITKNLWGFAQFGYLDNPLPSLFKERLFVYLSRFCDIRYCIARHVGFLVGLGPPSYPIEGTRKRTSSRRLRMFVFSSPMSTRVSKNQSSLSRLPQERRPMADVLPANFHSLTYRPSTRPDALGMLEALAPLN